MSTMKQGVEGGAPVFQLLPEEIVFEIFTRLSVKSLLKVRCVCKSWNSLISSPSFINTHLERNVSCDYLLVHSSGDKVFSLRCANTLAKYMDLELPRCERNFNVYDFSVYGSCNGLLCICGRYGTKQSPIYIWNPSNRKFKRLPEAYLYHHYTFTFALGFGFHHEENDYKVVRIVKNVHKHKVEVYSLIWNSWTQVSAALPMAPNLYDRPECAIHLNGVVYWMIKDRNSAISFILCFDMANEVFRKMELPEKLVGRIDAGISIREFAKSLSLIHLRQEEENCRATCCDIWVMGLGTWKMIRTILLPPLGRNPMHGCMAWPLSFTINGVQIVDYKCQNLVLYDPVSQQGKAITEVRAGLFGKIFVDAYKESLFLLD